MSILITDCDLGPPEIERAICAAAGVELAEARCRTENDVVAALDELRPSGLLVQYAPITAAVIERAPSVRAVARYGVGLDNVDVAAAAQAGVAVVNVPDYAVAEVADHAVALALALVRRLPYWTSETACGAWPPADSTMWPLRTLESTTFGLVGFGRIARVVASRMRAFGSEVVVHDPFVLETAIVGAGARPAGWQELWERAHIVSLHVPLTSDTKGLVDRDAFDCMQPGSYLVNTSRGGLVVRTALEHALEAGVLAGVGLDVWWSEPPDPEDPLLRDPRVLVTPHIAYLSAESMPRLRRLAVERLIARIRE